MSFISRNNPLRSGFLLSLMLLLALPAAAQISSLFGGDEAPVIDAATLQQTLAASADRENTPVILVDVRTPEEIAVSIIPGAITKAAYEEDAARYKGYRVISYCTVGYRSRKYTEALRDQGIDAVNFDGSILGWVEAGFPLSTVDGQPTSRVHTWSPKYSVPPGYEQVTR